MITNFTSNLLTRNTLGPKPFMFISFLFNSCAINNAKMKLRHFQANHEETKEWLALLISVYLHEENKNNNHNIKIKVSGNVSEIRNILSVAGNEYLDPKTNLESSCHSLITENYELFMYQWLNSFTYCAILTSTQKSSTLRLKIVRLNDK